MKIEIEINGDVADLKILREGNVLLWEQIPLGDGWSGCNLPFGSLPIRDNGRDFGALRFWLESCRVAPVEAADAEPSHIV